MRYKYLWGFLLLFYLSSNIFAYVVMPDFTNRGFFHYCSLGIQYLFSYGLYHIFFVLIVLCIIQSRKLLLQQILGFFLTYTLFLFLGIGNSISISSQYSMIIILFSIILLGILNSIEQKVSKYRYLFILFCGAIQGLGTADIFKNYYAPIDVDITVTIIIAFIIGLGLVLFGVIMFVYLASIFILRYKWNKKIILCCANIGIISVSLILLLKEFF